MQSLQCEKNIDVVRVKEKERYYDAQKIQTVIMYNLRVYITLGDDCFFVPLHIVHHRNGCLYHNL